MRYSLLYYIICFATSLSLCCACSDELPSSDKDQVQEGGIIEVGAGIEGLAVSSTATRASGETQDAEKVDWLVQPLKQGLDITYGNFDRNGRKQNERVAILTLLPEDGGSIDDKTYKTNATSGYAEYSFLYRAADNGAKTDEPARWYDNGLHYFEGVHVPNRIRYTDEVSELATENRTINSIQVSAVNNLTSDQSQDVSTGTDNNLSNYYLLSHYLGMPANTQIAATVARIKLPFRHRLARVLAYILIDPELKHNGANAKIEGYQNIETNTEKPFKDNPSTSSIRFCNVDVLEGVHDDYNSTTQIHTLTPKWKEKERKVVPHFHEQLPSFITYETDKKTFYQGTSDFPTSQPAGSKKVEYTNVPVYDLIVRPTYTSEENVMYDEDLTGTNARIYAQKNNQIDFTVSLNNGLTYEKHFEFDLDANYQTIVYLRITREGVDYNESGSALWDERTEKDLWYGVDNQNGHNLSEAGSSWQRAYYNTHLNDGDNITDGGFYDEDTSGEDGTPGQYVSDATWIKNFIEAYQGGTHHGDYFVLAKDITIDAATLPSDGLVFTGHLDGFNTHGSRGYHTITLLHAGEAVQCSATATDVLSKLFEDNRCTQKVPQLYWYQEIAQAPAHSNDISIPLGDPIEIDRDKTYPNDLTQLDNEGKIVLYKDAGVYKLYNNRVFYKKAPAYLFAGLNGVYTTRQETAANPYGEGFIWEANVHKEGDYWLPYRDVTGSNPSNTGWRAEVMNLTIQDGSLFKEDCFSYADTDNDPATPSILTGYDVNKVSGYVYNCKEADVKVLEFTPAMPKYK